MPEPTPDRRRSFHSGILSTYLTRLPPPRRMRGEDALIATAALKAGASTILTWNRRNFEPFAGDIRIESPP